MHHTGHLLWDTTVLHSLIQVTFMHLMYQWHLPQQCTTRLTLHRLRAFALVMRRNLLTTSTMVQFKSMVLYIGILTNFVNLLLINKLEIYSNKGVENSIPLFLFQIKEYFIYFKPFNFALLIGFFNYLYLVIL